MSPSLPTLALLGLLVAPGAQAAERSGGAWKLVDLPEDDERFSAGEAGAVSGEPWWEAFGSAALDEVVEEGLRANPDLATAQQRVLAARAQASQAMAGFLPVLTADGSVKYAPTESLGFGFGIPGQFDQDVYSQGSVGLNAALGIDLFGRRITGWRAGRLEALAAEGDQDAIALTLTSRIVAGWLDLVAAREQVVMVEEQVATAQALLELTELRYQVSGDASGLDVLQQRQQLQATRARLPQAHLSEALASQGLAVLLGRRAWTQTEGVAEQLPALPPPPSVGTPAELLANRPDLRAATERVDAAHLRSLSATLAVLPSLGASAGVGQQFIDTGEATWQDTWNVGLSLSVPLFNGGLLYNGMREARAGERTAALGFEGTLLSAIQEVEGALAQEARMVEVLEANQAQLEAARLAFEAARERYGQGLVTYQQALTSLTALQSAQQAELSARRAVLDARIALHQSLGGTWTRQVARPSGADR